MRSAALPSSTGAARTDRDAEGLQVPHVFINLTKPIKLFSSPFSFTFVLTGGQELSEYVISMIGI